MAMDKKAVALLAMTMMEEEESAFEWMRKKHKREQDSDELLLPLLAQQQSLGQSCLRAAVAASMEPEVHVRTDLFVESVVPHYTPSDFRSHFHMDRDTVEFFLGYLGRTGLNTPGYCGGNTPITLETMALTTIWYLANQESMRGIAERFDVGLSSVHVVVKKVTSHLVERIEDFISWPTEESIPNVAAEFKAQDGFPGVIGAIDGIIISVIAPLNHRDKRNHHKVGQSLIVQAVCDNSKKFTNCCVGAPAVVHDTGVAYNSQLFQQIAENPQAFFPNESYHIVGHSAYPLKTWLMVPYKDNGLLSAAERKFNNKQEHTRIVAELSFALLKGRFGLLKEMHGKLETISNLIMVACILHNVCLENNDEGEDFLDFEDLTLVSKHFADSSWVNGNDRAKEKRDYMAYTL